MERARAALETALNVETATDAEEAQKKAREALEASLLDDVVSPAKEAKAREQARVALETALNVETDTLPQLPPKKVPASTLVALLDAVSIRDRKIGELTAKLHLAKQRIAEREEHCRVVEEEVAQAIKSGNHLDLDIEWHIQALLGAEKRSGELEAMQRRMFNALDPFRRKALDVGAGDYSSMLSPRSTDLPTAAGLSEDRFSTVAGWSPRTPRRHLLQPLAPTLS